MKKQTDRRKVLILASLGIVLIVLILIFFRSGGTEKIKQSRPESSAARASAKPREAQETKQVTVFFLSEEDGLLHGEKREIFASASVVQEAKEAVEELVKGSQKGHISPLPPETKLRQLFITKEGVAYVDFSQEIMDKHPSGSSAELATVYSIVNSLAGNFSQIKKVFILVEGSERETLGGHINLSQPFLPMYSLVAD